jgi:hypothetical protein
MTYREKHASTAEKAKEELAKISQELDMGY